MTERLWDFVAWVVCAAGRHRTPSSWGNTALENVVLRELHKVRDWEDGKLIFEVSCFCGKKMIPFRAKPLSEPYPYSKTTTALGIVALAVYIAWRLNS